MKKILRFICWIFCYYQEEDFDWMTGQEIRAGWRLRFGWSMLLMLVLIIGLFTLVTWN